MPPLNEVKDLLERIEFAENSLRNTGENVMADYFVQCRYAIKTLLEQRDFAQGLLIKSTAKILALEETLNLIRYQKEMDSPLTEKERRVLEKNDVWLCDCGYRHSGVYEGFQCMWCGRFFHAAAYKVGIYCKLCKYLSPKEHEQHSEPHMCQKYDKFVTHMGQHPEIVRLGECDEPIK